MSSSLGFSEEDSLHFSATETPLPSPPSPSPSGTLATPPDVYKAFEEEEFGDDKKKLFSMDTFKRRRKQQGLELQLLVAENTLLQAKLKAAVSEKEDAIQMWRKEREENKRLRSRVIELEGGVPCERPQANAPTSDCQVADLGGKTSLQMIESNLSRGSVLIPPPARHHPSLPAPGEESPLTLRPKRKRPTPLRGDLAKAPLLRESPLKSLLQEGAQNSGADPRAPYRAKVSITNNGLRTKRMIELQKKLDRKKERKLHIPQDAIPMGGIIESTNMEHSVDKPSEQGKEKEKGKEKEETPYKGKEKEKEKENVQNHMEILPPHKKRRLGGTSSKRSRKGAVMSSLLPQQQILKDAVSEGEEGYVVDLDDAEDKLKRKRRKKGETGPKVYPCRDCKRVFCRRGDRDNHERLVGHTKWSKGKSFNLGFVQT